ncbi:putative MFS family transporter [Pseudomonas sp. CFII64]|uniref:MFS transporter n=1 Tax=Pseudomonas sp. CFII64 TaxID=911242 RepID=UPI0003578EA4|nr:MFS transporter [Pseudomonas sp. CFII64]EPJ76915.1 putative MFS family transporter [Pseudomonas sp. CFII64]
MPHSSSTAHVAKSTFSFSLLMGVLLIAANLRAPITAIGPVLSQIQDFFSFSPSVAGLLNALPLLMFACASPLAPWLTRRFGLEHALLGALVMIAVGALTRSTGLYSGLWLGTLLIGAGIAVANVLVVPLVKRDFPGHTALCIGLYAATMALLAALASGLAAPLSALSSYAWQLSLGVWFFLALLAAVCWWPHAKSARARSAFPVPAGRTTVWRSAVGWQISMFMALQTVSFYTLIDWFPAIAASTGIGATQAGLYLFAYQAVAVVANLSTSVAIKRMRDQRLLGFICSLAIVIGVLGLIFEPAISLVWLLFAGVGAGMSMVTCLSLFGLRARDHHEASSLSAMGQCVGYGLGASGPFLAGWLHGLTSSWHHPLLVLLAAALMQVVFAVLAGRARYVGQ